MHYLTLPAFVSSLIVEAQSSCSVHSSKDQAQIAVNYANGNGMVSIAPMHTNNTTSQTCPSFSHTVEGFIISHRLAYLFATVAVLNFISIRSKAKVLAVPWAKHLSPANLDFTIAAQTRVCLTPLLLLGFLAELYRWLTGCSLAGTYVLTCASWSGVADAWEWIRRWPLSWDLVLHHGGVLSLCVAIIEFQVLPAGGGSGPPHVCCSSQTLASNGSVILCCDHRSSYASSRQWNWPGTWHSGVLYLVPST